MSGRMRYRTLLALAGDGLRRKIGRNLLTVSGVFIGVLALTLIVSLGEGLSAVIRGTVAQGGNLRQIGLSGGFGNPISEDTDVRIEGVADPARRARLRRAALARRRPGPRIGRRAQTLDQAALDGVAQIEHVTRVTPIVLERYAATSQGHSAAAAASLGVDLSRRRYADRVIAGNYLSGPNAREVLLHEYLAYQWGYRTVADLEGLVGQPLTLKTLGAAGAGSAMVEIGRSLLKDVMGSELVETLTEAERKALPGIAQKVMAQLAGAQQAPGAERTYTVKIAGIVRELEPDDAFNVIEDGNALQADLYFPEAVAKRMYLDAPINQELGYMRALVVVDDAAYAPDVETELRERGYTAFSVASVLRRVESAVTAVTVVIAFLTGIALLVAALGIVNTMVTSVLERTREIGLWKALGATSGQVRAVFLLEAGLIGLLGGLLGLATALLLMIPGEGVAQRLIAERAVVPISIPIFQVPLWLPLAGPLLATFVAMLASLYPAHRAAQIDPVRALRHD